MKNANAKQKANSLLARLPKSARIAVIVTAVLLLAAIIFGIVWSSIDHSFRYDRIDLSQYFANGENPFNYKTVESLKRLPIRLETALTEEKVLDRIETNLKGITPLSAFRKPAANVDPSSPYQDIVYMYYEVYQPTTTTGGKDTLLISNTSYVASPASGTALNHETAAAGATVVRLGSGDLNALLEKWMQNYPEFGTSVTRVLDKDTVVETGYTYVLDVKGTYRDGETDKTYLSLLNYYYQPNPAPEGKDYYTGNDTVLNETTAYDSSVKKADPAVVTAVNEAAAALTKIGEEKKIELSAKIDTGTNTYPATFTVTLKAAFLAEQKVAEIDLDGDDSLADKDGKKITFTYKNPATSKDETIETGKLKIRLTVESVLSLNKATVNELTKDLSGFSKPKAPANTANYDEDAAYANAYIAYVKDDMMADAIATVKKSASYLTTLRSTLWHEVVDAYSSDSIITSIPEEVYDELYESTIEYHEEMYESQSSASYKSLEEYILKAVYDDEDSLKLSADQQKAKVEEHIAKELRESIVEKMILFAIAESRGLEVTNKEIRDYKDEYRESVYNSYLSYYKAIYGSQMSEGEIKIQCKDAAKETANSYEKTYYRESVMLRKVQEILVPHAVDFEGEITWTYQGEAGHEH